MKTSHVEIEQRAVGIAALGRVERDADGFTVFDAGVAPDAFRVWDDAYAGRRCTCERFDAAFRVGRNAVCEHTLAVAIWCDAPEDAYGDGAGAIETVYPPLRRIV